MGSPKSIAEDEALDALWGKSSIEAGRDCGAHPSVLRRILLQQSPEVRSAFRVAYFAERIIEATTDEVILNLASDMLTQAAKRRRDEDPPGER